MRNPDLIGVYEKLGAKLQRIVSSDKNLRNAILLIHSDRYNIHLKFAFGTTGKERRTIEVDNPYHVASIGKTFTSVIIARLFERDLISYEDPIAKYLSPGLLKDLFVCNGVDYSGKVLVRHLLNHTSGVADYYEDKPVNGKPVRRLLVEEPDRFWKPDDTIDYTRQNFEAVAAPGKRFHYSDTGYNLLGKIIEKMTGKEFHVNLHDEIFSPLGMDSSYFLHYSQPKTKSKHEIADTYIDNHEVSTFRSTSVDWAGGGIVSTTEDLLRFHSALVKNVLLKKATLDMCMNDTRKFSIGMEYGYGILLLNVRKLTVVLPQTLNMWGNFGSIAAYMFYNPAYDIYIIGSFNHSGYAVRQIRFLISVIRMLSNVLT